MLKRTSGTISLLVAGLIGGIVGFAGCWIGFVDTSSVSDECSSQVSGERPMGFREGLLSTVEETWLELERLDRKADQLQVQGMGSPVAPHFLASRLQVWIAERRTSELLDEFGETIADHEGHVAEFANAVGLALFRVLVRMQEFDHLSALLCVWFPEQVDKRWGIEQYLVFTNSEVPDPIMLILDVYDRSRSPQVKQSVVVVLRRAFPNISGDPPFPQSGPPMTDPASFVDQCRSWYTSNRGRLVINEDYALKQEDLGVGAAPLYLIRE